ncbi:MAG: TonB-dependent receptor [Betaproteobacteria bacterium]|nr:TonB-dependent receptor [Betaproteobacteria bacterium]
MKAESKDWLRKAALLGGLVLVLALAGLWIHHLIGGTKAKKHYVSELTLVKPPPPPPPKEEKPPPEPVKREEVKIDQPKPDQAPEPKSDDNKPAGKDLGVDADGNGSGDGFGLVGRKGGTDLLASGGGNGGGGANRAQFSVFTSSAQQILREQITKHLKLKSRDYRATYKIWLDGEGNIKRFELTPTGSAEVDEDLRMALAEVRGLNLAPPPDLPQPLRFQFTLRPAG